MPATESVVLHLPADVAVAARFRIARVAAFLKPLEAADCLGLSLKTYQRIENGTRLPTAQEVQTMAGMTGQALAFFGPKTLNMPGTRQLA